MNRNRPVLNHSGRRWLREYLCRKTASTSTIAAAGRNFDWAIPFADTLPAREKPSCNVPVSMYLLQLTDQQYQKSVFYILYGTE